MLERLGLPRPQIATKLYGVIALSLAVVYVLAAGTIQFASQTEDAVGRFQQDGLGIVLLSASLERALEQQRRLVATAPTAADAQRREDERAFDELSATIPGLMERMGSSHKLARRAADLALQGALVFAFVRDQRQDLANAMAADYASAMDDLQRQVLTERIERADVARALLETIAASSRSLITWVSAAAAACGLLIAPVGLLLLSRVLSRLEGVGTALVRLARNDTSVDIPGLAHQDEVGQLARSAAVFKAKSIELLQKKSELERLNLQLDVAINNMPLGLSMFDAQERLLVCNRRYSEMYDLPGELTQPGTVHCAHWDYREKQGARHYTAAEEHGPPDRDNAGSMTIEFGNERIIAVARQPLKDGGWVALHEDITHRRRQEQEITRLACHDPLTNLANRALFREQLQQSLLRLGRGQAFAVLCLDLDRFKAVNDTLGHPVGDALLKEVSARLLACVRQGDVVARLGGDEFAIIQANVRDPGSTEVLASRIVETVSKPYEIGGQRIDISTSVGMTLAPRDGSDADQLMSNADLALYRVKGAGRRGFSFFKAEMNDRIQMRRSLEADLRKAFEKEELALFYQPLVCLKSQTVTGFEALMRWTHPKHGTIPPAEFIGIAEEIGLISQLGEWALRQACVHAAHWSRPVKVALNLSPLQIRRDLIEAVLQALASSGLPPNRLELEVTEAVLLQDIQSTLATLHQLRQLGVRIVMDDFGTGYCSLSYLRSFPFDKIKIDRGFIADIDRSAQSRAIVETIVGLGGSLGMATVAEGIENVEQLQMVRSFGCAQAQGYYFSPPIGAGEIERLLGDTFEHTRNAA